MSERHIQHEGQHIEHPDLWLEAPGQPARRFCVIGGQMRAKAGHRTTGIVLNFFDPEKPIESGHPYTVYVPTEQVPALFMILRTELERLERGD